MTSKAGFAASVAVGTIRTGTMVPSSARPVITVTSVAARSSIGISATPSRIVQSMVEEGTATQNGTPLSCAASALR